MTPEGKVKAHLKGLLYRLGCVRAGSKEADWPSPINGWYYMPTQNGRGVHGIPDFICFWRGQFFSVETKAPGGTPTENQKDRGREIILGGGLWIVFDEVPKPKRKTK